MIAFSNGGNRLKPKDSLTYKSRLAKQAVDVIMIIGDKQTRENVILRQKVDESKKERVYVIISN